MFEFDGTKRTGLNRSRGQVFLVGAGPGDPGLLTVAGLEALEEAEVVVHDRLVSRSLLAKAAGARLIDVGKTPNKPSTPQAEIHRILIREAGLGYRVVRLKGGDPFLYGRGGEEVLALRAAGVVTRLIPGVSSVLAGPAAAGIPLTHRRLARSVAIVTGHVTDDHGPDWRHLVKIDTLVVLMGVGNLQSISHSLLAEGRSGRTPVAVVERATLPEQRVLKSTLSEVAEQARRCGVRPPAVIVIGEVVAALDESCGPWLAEVPALSAERRLGPLNYPSIRERSVS